MNFYVKCTTMLHYRLVLRRQALRLALACLALLGLSALFASGAQAGVQPQQPTVAIATVTGTPVGTTVTVNPDQEQINVRSGPSTDYPIVGVLVLGQTAPALGRSAGGDWIKIVYPGVEGGVGWVYAYIVTPSGSLPIVEPPPTPTPRVTPTIDPTLAAQFVVELQPTRLPTFTQPPPLAIPTYTDAGSMRNSSVVPMGFVLVGLGVVGLFGLLISFFRGR